MVGIGRARLGLSLNRSGARASAWHARQGQGPSGSAAPALLLGQMGLAEPGGLTAGPGAVQAGIWSGRGLGPLGKEVFLFFLNTFQCISNSKKVHKIL
jgi:hypothetical protein